MNTVSLSLKTILRECVKKDSSSLEKKIRDHNHKILHDILLLTKIEEDFVDTCICDNDNWKHLVGYIRPSYEEYLRKLCYFLNHSVEGEIEDSDELEKALLERVNCLNEIGNLAKKEEIESCTKNEFPVIYDDICIGQGALKGIEYKYGNVKNTKRREEEGYYYRRALFKSFKTSVQRQAKLYERMVRERHRYRDKISTVSYNHEFRNNLDMDKFYMYVMYEYLNAAEKSRSIEETENYLNLVKRYLKSNVKKDVSITTDNSVIVNINTIREKLQILEARLQEEKNPCMVGWDILPEGGVGKGVRRVSPPRTMAMSREKLEKLRQIGEEKKAFYKKNAPLQEVIGLKEYKGYIGYIYPNGKVILDRMYNPDAPSTATGNGIYIMDVELFEALSGLKKAVLRKDPKVGIMYHNSTWQERLKKIIDEPETEESRNKALQLVMKIKKRSKL